MSTQLPPIPPGPADTTHPRRALARLALSYAYADAADFAAGGVPTVSDEYADPWDYVDHAARLLIMAQDVLARAAVYARETRRHLVHHRQSVGDHSRAGPRPAHRHR